MGDGEQAYLDLVRGKLGPTSQIMDVGCGHGGVALLLASDCDHIVAYDRIHSYVEVAQRNAQAAGATNVSYLTHDARSSEDGGIHLPAEDQSLDMIISRHGPLHWIAYAGRVLRPGGAMVGLMPMEEPIPAWTSKLPQILYYESSGRHTGTGSIHQSVENRLHQAGLTLHSGWGFDVPEIFSEPRQLYNVVTWGLPQDRIPDYDEVSHRFERVFETYTEPRGELTADCAVSPPPRSRRPGQPTPDVGSQALQ